MIFDSIGEFLHMGGYAKYVWPSYAMTFIVVILNIVWARRLLARSRADARRRLATQGEKV